MKESKEPLETIQMSALKGSEVHAYAFILDELVSKKGWDKRKIYTQQECHQIKSIKKCLGKKTPENVIKISEKIYWIIEAKNERRKLDQALKEAREDYADKINESPDIKALFITGIAGNHEEGFIAKSEFFKNGKWTTIKENGIELTALLSESQIKKIIENNDSDLKEIEISDKEFLKTAEEINGILHEGGIHKDYRARIMSALLLALSEGTDIDLDQKPSLLISSINSRIDIVLKKHNKSEFARFIKIDLPSSEDNHNKFKRAIVLTIQELLGLNIRSAMQSGKDVLGKFYEVFLKYGNGAKEIGIVLTPRHITKFAAEVLDIKSNDLVLDPTCGTGGFLVAAFDEVKKKSNAKEFENFKNWGLYGVEEQDPVVSLALVNMIFRGDGKNNIIEGNCFSKWLNATNKNGISCAQYLTSDTKNRIPPITKVLMNPPFPKKKTDLKEFLFVNHALKQMQNNGLLFSILPYSCMIKGGRYLQWRKDLLKNNSLVSVITFPADLFYPVGVHTIGIFIRKGIPHKKGQKIYWIRILNDGLLKKKGKRLPSLRAKNDLIKINNVLKLFIKDNNLEIKNIPEFQKATFLDFDDPDLELVPEAYLDSKIPNKDEIKYEMENLIRESVAYLIKYRKEGFLYDKNI